MGFTRKVHALLGSRSSKTREVSAGLSVEDNIGAAEVELNAILRDVRAFIRDTPTEQRPG